ncbi:XdhC family protein [Ideonella oryzae]|uniref:XdhC family protein n=1 Tax=Ideonella oryzae TaxID=2937441 RepID=A0ABT1BQW4_9BURK|nr:XdhC family protein [Ideonella oryzae]MCO5978209.1 XdhC family protein [Ideonella oryzae]
MHFPDIAALRAAVAWQQAGHRVALATVLSTWGSAPRPVGSLLVIRDDGRTEGSVSGGCVEDDLVDHARTRMATAGALPEVRQYGVDTGQARRAGLPCGGQLGVLLEPDPPAEAMQDLLTALTGGERRMRRVDSLSGQWLLLPAMGVGQPLRWDGRRLTQTLGTQYRLLLIGANQIAGYLAPMAMSCGFAVTVCDPRPEMEGDTLPPQVALRRDMPDDATLAFAPDAHSAVVTLTHDPKLDDLALMEALTTPAFLVGALGSQRSNDARRARLREHFGLSVAQLARLRGPVGLPLGSKRPPEIAVSILAQLLAEKNRLLDPAPASACASALT